MSCPAHSSDQICSGLIPGQISDLSSCINNLTLVPISQDLSRGIKTKPRLFSRCRIVECVTGVTGWSCLFEGINLMNPHNYQMHSN